jgi:hypothetical protein
MGAGKSAMARAEPTSPPATEPSELGSSTASAGMMTSHQGPADEQRAARATAPAGRGAYARLAFPARQPQPQPRQWGGTLQPHQLMPPAWQQQHLPSMAPQQPMWPTDLRDVQPTPAAQWGADWPGSGSGSGSGPGWAYSQQMAPLRRSARSPTPPVYIQNDAALTIQCFYRGYKVRRRSRRADGAQRAPPATRLGAATAAQTGRGGAGVPSIGQLLVEQRRQTRPHRQTRRHQARSQARETDTLPPMQQRQPRQPRRTGTKPPRGRRVPPLVDGGPAAAAERMRAERVAATGAAAAASATAATQQQQQAVRDARVREWVATGGRISPGGGGAAHEAHREAVARSLLSGRKVPGPGAGGTQSSERQPAAAAGTQAAAAAAADEDAAAGLILGDAAAAGVRVPADEEGGRARGAEGSGAAAAAAAAGTEAGGSQGTAGLAGGRGSALVSPSLASESQRGVQPLSSSDGYSVVSSSLSASPASRLRVAPPRRRHHPPGRTRRRGGAAAEGGAAQSGSSVTTAMSSNRSSETSLSSASSSLRHHRHSDGRWGSALAPPATAGPGLGSAAAAAAAAGAAAGAAGLSSTVPGNDGWAAAPHYGGGGWAAQWWPHMAPPLPAPGPAPPSHHVTSAARPTSVGLPGIGGLGDGGLRGGAGHLFGARGLAQQQQQQQRPATAAIVSGSGAPPPPLAMLQRIERIEGSLEQLLARLEKQEP